MAIRWRTILVMALYEYTCEACGTRTEKRMAMADVLQFIPCPSCGGQAKKAFGRFALVGKAQPGVADGPAPWEREDGDTHDDGSGDSHDHAWGSHSHSHSHGGHSHSHGWDDGGLDDDF